MIDGRQSHIVFGARSEITLRWTLIGCLLLYISESFPPQFMRFIDVHFTMLVTLVPRLCRLNILLNFFSGFLKHLTLDYLFDCWHAGIPSHVSRCVLVSIIVGFGKLIRNLIKIPHAVWESNGVEERIRVLSVNTIS